MTDKNILYGDGDNKQYEMGLSDDKNRNEPQCKRRKIVIRWQYVNHPLI